MPGRWGKLSVLANLNATLCRLIASFTSAKSHASVKSLTPPSCADGVCINCALNICMRPISEKDQWPVPQGLILRFSLYGSSDTMRLGTPRLNWRRTFFWKEQRLGALICKHSHVHPRRTAISWLSLLIFVHSFWDNKNKNPVLTRQHVF